MCRARYLITAFTFCLAALWPQNLFSQPRTPSSGSALEKNVGFSFAAPAGWRLKRYASYSYSLQRKGIEPGCPITLTTERGSSLSEAQTSRIEKVRSVFPGPGTPIINRVRLRSESGVQILKADVRADAYVQPRRSGHDVVYPTRDVLYSFRSLRRGEFHNLLCTVNVEDGTLYDDALDQMAKSVALVR